MLPQLRGENLDLLGCGFQETKAIYGCKEKAVLGSNLQCLHLVVRYNSISTEKY